MMYNYCTLDDIKALYIRFATAYGYKFTSVHQTKEMVQLWYHEWYEALAGIDKNLVMQAFAECKIQSEWPPSIAEIIKTCDKKMGLPNIHEVMTLASRKEFIHPIVEEIYKKIGDWSFRNDTEKALLSKIKLYYPEILANLRLNRQKKALASDNKLIAIEEKELINDKNKSVIHSYAS